ncbi:LAME_0F10110g1_1 [Lachancea meyersii CBS 8951]|uniref:LAME_0F10110g1_1 n=1 Tax=Lachancea meyersii CBS 8951 TaxID=1266667 RepID=A0A1G4JVQ5_9SACH|nr:LAME_0F10110g1_1 [Lachancea meyersii CBS 8951]
MLSLSQRRRLTQLSRKVILLVILLLCIFSCSSIRVHLANMLRQPANVGAYEGGAIDDVKLIRCYRWYIGCDTVFERTDRHSPIKLWLRVKKDLNNDKLFAIDWHFLYHTFLYVHPAKPAFEHGCVSDLVITNDRSVVPVQVLRDVNDRLRSSDSSMFHKHDHQVDCWSKMFGATSENLIVRGEDWHYKGSGVWCKYSPARSDKDSELITNIQIFVANEFVDPRPSWKSAVAGLLRKEGLPLFISYQKINPNKMPFKYADYGNLFTRENEFKILQLSDLHFVGSSYQCGVKSSLEDLKTAQFVRFVLKKEAPDLVIFTGDLIEGSSTLDYQAAIMKALGEVILAGVPWILSWGQSDYSRFASKSQILDFVKELPFGLVKMNKRVAQYAAANTTTNALTLNNEKGLVGVIYVLDSTSAENPVDFMEAAHEQITGNFYGEPLYSLIFQHSPIPEYRPSGAFPIIGSFNEKELLDVAQFGIGGAMRRLGVQALSCGREHGNDCCLYDRSVWLCYGGQTGVAGYSLSESENSIVRLFRIDHNIREITTWKRSSGMPDEVYDYQFLFKNAD